jgi:hypothetical protein
MTLSTYAHLFDELDGADHRPAEEQIRTARLAAVSPRCPFCVRIGDTTSPRAKENPGLAGLS